MPVLGLALVLTPGAAWPQPAARTLAQPPVRLLAQSSDQPGSRSPLQPPAQPSARSLSPAHPPAALPEPLTLEFALSISGEGHPDVVEREAALARSRALLDAEAAHDAPSVRLVGRARFIEPDPSVAYREHDDHTLRFSVRKPLWDFGRGDAAKEAARAVVESERWRLAGARHAQRMDVLRGYFDVLLADLEYARENEAMAIAFVVAQRARERNALGQVSDIETLELESTYQRVRRARFAAAARQRASRARLANVLNRPGELSSRLVSPSLTVLGRTIPDYEALEKEAVRDNAAIKAARARAAAARRRVEEARAGGRPMLSGGIETGVNTRPTGSGDRLRIGVILEIPFAGGGRREAEVAQREAELTAAQAALRRVEIDVRQALLESWLALDTLAAERDSTEAFAVYRDLYLDRSRAFYEHEVRADLGDAMVQISESALRSARVDFELALAWARIHGLTGRDPDTLGEWLSGSGER